MIDVTVITAAGTRRPSRLNPNSVILAEEVTDGTLVTLINGEKFVIQERPEEIFGVPKATLVAAGLVPSTGTTSPSQEDGFEAENGDSIATVVIDDTEKSPPVTTQNVSNSGPVAPKPKTKVK